MRTRKERFVFCPAWANQNNLFENSIDPSIYLKIEVVQTFDDTGNLTNLSCKTIDRFNPLVAELLMIGSSIFVFWRLTVGVVSGLAVILGGRHWHFLEIVNVLYFDLASIPSGGTLILW
jgi:hypothetical protein